MNQDTLQRALNHFGFPRQKIKAIEECAELTVALLHGDEDEIRGEIADVLIMAGQLRIMFGADLVDTAVEAKLDRLRKRMEAA